MSQKKKNRVIYKIIVCYVTVTNWLTTTYIYEDSEDNTIQNLLYVYIYRVLNNDMPIFGQYHYQKYIFFLMSSNSSI